MFFLLRLLRRLQGVATVAAIDLAAYEAAMLSGDE